MQPDLRDWVALHQGMMETERVKGDRKDNIVTCRLGMGTPAVSRSQKDSGEFSERRGCSREVSGDPSELEIREVLWEVSPTRQSCD